MLCFRLGRNQVHHRYVVEMAEWHIHIYAATVGKVWYGVHCVIHLASHIDWGNPQFCDWRKARADISSFLIQ